MLFAGVVLVAVVVSRAERFDTLLSHPEDNPAVRGSDELNPGDNKASAFIGGAVSLKDFPPQCVRIVSGDSQCMGPNSECAHCMDGNGFCKPRHNGKGDVHLEKVDGVGKFADYYFLTIQNSQGHPMMAAMRSTDGYSREWNQIGTIWTDKIHKPAAEGRSGSAVDLLQVVHICECKYTPSMLTHIHACIHSAIAREGGGDIEHACIQSRIRTHIPTCTHACIGDGQGDGRELLLPVPVRSIKFGRGEIDRWIDAGRADAK